MTVFAITAFLLFGAFTLSCILTLRRSEAEAMAAAQGAGTVFILLLIVLGVWWDDNALLPIALAGVVLALPSALVMARLISHKLDERGFDL